MSSIKKGGIFKKDIHQQISWNKFRFNLFFDFSKVISFSNNFAFAFPNVLWFVAV